MLSPARKHQLGGPPPKKRKPRKYPEAAEQIAIVGWLRARGEVVIWSDSGAKRTPQQVARWRRMGGMPGWPDLILPRLRVAIEVKAPGGKTTREQDLMHETLRAFGWCVIVGSLDDVLRHPVWYESAR